MSVPSKYLFLCARQKFRFNKKIRKKLLIVYVDYGASYMLKYFCLGFRWDMIWVWVAVGWLDIIYLAYSKII